MGAPSRWWAVLERQCKAGANEIKGWSNPKISKRAVNSNSVSLILLLARRWNVSVHVILNLPHIPKCQVDA